MDYKFNSDKYVTRGIQEELPIELQMFLWRKIEGLIQDGVELDYLQVFTLTRHGSVLRIEHEQEMKDPFNMVYLVELNESEQDIKEGKIFAIDDINHATMLWSYEY